MEDLVYLERPFTPGSWEWSVGEHSWGSGEGRQRREQLIKNILESWFIQNDWENYSL